MLQPSRAGRRAMNALLEAVYDSAIGTFMRTSPTAFPWVESVHVVAIALVFGTIAIIDVRLIGWPTHRSGARRLIRDLLPYTWAAFALAAVTGLLLFSSNAVDYSGNTAFRAKMVAILMAAANMGVFHVTAYRRIAGWDTARRPPAPVRLMGATSLALWVSVIFLGRWIGFTMW